MIKFQLHYPLLPLFPQVPAIPGLPGPPGTGAYTEDIDRNIPPEPPDDPIG